MQTGRVMTKRKHVRPLPRHRWTEGEIALVKRRYPTDPVADIARDMRLEVRQIYSLAKRLGIRKHAPQPRHVWSDAQIALVRAQYADTRTDVIALQLGVDIDRVYRLANKLGLSKSTAFLTSQNSGRLNKLSAAGREYRFVKGIVPHNKGKRGGPSVGRMAETQFKKGAKPHTWMPIGSTRLSKEGYVQVKMTDTGHPPRDWVALHLLVWELHRGATPPKHHVAFIDGDKAHIEIGNLELVSYADMMKRNTLHQYPKEIVHTIQLRAAINRQINKRTRRENNEPAHDQ